MATQEQRVTAGVAAVAREAGKARAHEKCQRLVDDCRTLPPTTTAVVHPKRLMDWLPDLGSNQGPAD